MSDVGATCQTALILVLGASGELFTVTVIMPVQVVS